MGASKSKKTEKAVDDFQLLKKQINLIQKEVESLDLMIDGNLKEGVTREFFDFKISSINERICSLEKELKDTRFNLSFKISDLETKISFFEFSKKMDEEESDSSVFVVFIILTFLMSVCALVLSIWG